MAFGQHSGLRRVDERADAGADSTKLSSAECVLASLEPPIDIVRRRVEIICKGENQGLGTRD